MARRDMLISKPTCKRRTPFIPSEGVVALNRHAQALTQTERQALREIREDGDIIDAYCRT